MMVIGAVVMTVAAGAVVVKMGIGNMAEAAGGVESLCRGCSGHKHTFIVWHSVYAVSSGWCSSKVLVVIFISVVLASC